MPGTRLDVAESRRQGRCFPGRASLSGQAWAAGHRKALWENRLMTGVREQPSAAVFVFAVAVVFHLRPNDFPKLEMWLFTPKAAISHPHPSPHTHTHTHSTWKSPKPSRVSYLPLISPSPHPQTLGGCWIWPLYWAQGQLLLLPSLPSGVTVWVCVSGVDVCKRRGSASIGVWPQSVCSPHC